MYKILMEVSVELSTEDVENMQKEYGTKDLEIIKTEMKKAFETEKGFVINKIAIKTFSDCCKAEMITVDVWNEIPRQFKCSSCGQAIS